MLHYVPTPSRNDPLWGALLSMYYNAHRGKHDRAMPPDAFMPYRPPPPDPFEEDITAEQLMERLRIHKS